jgi:hypothetical protein
MTALVLALLLHHSFSAVFDGAKPVTLTGVVTKVEWANPHVFFYLDVKGPDGAVTSWAAENGGTNTLVRQGFTRHTLKVNDSVTVEGCLAHSGAKLVFAQRVTLGDGRSIFGSAAGNCQLPEAR